MTRLTTVLLTAAVLGAAAGADAATPDLRTLFPHQAELRTDDDRLSRLELTPEVMGACRGDLSDLRVFDAGDREVPYLIDGGLPAAAGLEVQQSFEPELLEVSQERIEPEGAVRTTRETYEVAAPPEASQTGFWDLVVEARRRSFVRRVEVTARGPGGTDRVLLTGSVFRLEDPPREKTRLTLPAFGGPAFEGPAFEGRLAVTFEGEDGSYLEPVLRFESARSLPARERAVLELEELSRRSDDRRTLLEVARPRGLVPDVVVVATSTAAFNRRVEVWDEGPGAGEEALGRGALFRVRATTAVEQVEISLGPARGDRLRLVIDDGDSPPLADLAVNAVVRRPALLFSLPPAADGPSGFLRFGGGRAYRPQYDLTALAPHLPAAGVAAEVAERLYDPALLGTARLGPVAANPHFDPAPVLAFAHRAGSEIDRRVYRHRRSLDVVPSAEGLARLHLAPEDLAVTRPDLADLRIVDGEGRQRAYLLERGARDQLPLVAAPPVTEDGVSSYALALPVTPATVDRIVVDTPAPFFDRAYELRAKQGKAERTLARGRLARRIGDPRPVEIAFEARRLDALELRVEDGDDAPLPLGGVTARLSVADLYLAVPAGRYELLLGRPEDRPPRYELARVRDVVLAVASSEADAGTLEENPDYRARFRLATAAGRQRLLLWLVLAAAVVVLALLTLRMARRDGGEAPP